MPPAVIVMRMIAANMEGAFRDTVTDRVAYRVGFPQDARRPTILKWNPATTPVMVFPIKSWFDFIFGS